MAAFCLGLGIGCGALKGTGGSEESMDKAIEEKEEEVTACHHHQGAEQEVHYQLQQLIPSCIFSSHQKTYIPVGREGDVTFLHTPSETCLGWWWAGMYFCTKNGGWCSRADVAHQILEVSQMRQLACRLCQHSSREYLTFPETPLA